MGTFNSRSDSVTKVMVFIDEAGNNFFFERKDVFEDIIRSRRIPGYCKLIEVLVIFQDSVRVDQFVPLGLEVGPFSFRLEVL